MIDAIVAGFLIALCGYVNLTVSGYLGAMLFSLGLSAVVVFKFNLFTGKAGLYISGQISITELTKIWIGNFIGVLFCILLLTQTAPGEEILDRASAIVDNRLQQTELTNFVEGIFCGVLMYLGVTGFHLSGNFLFTIFPVMCFILCGFGHCIADMFYYSIAAKSPSGFLPLAHTTLGNFVGCNLIPLIYRKKEG